VTPSDLTVAVNREADCSNESDIHIASASQLAR
jgi:hypothetical protein